MAVHKPGRLERILAASEGPALLTAAVTLNPRPPELRVHL